MKEFRPRLTDQMLQVLCAAIDREASRLADVYDDKKRLANDMAHKLMAQNPNEIYWDRDPEYQKLWDEVHEAKRKVTLLEDVETQFKRLLENETKGRRRVLRPWQSRLFHVALRKARE